METKLSKINTILDLPIKSTTGSQRSLTNSTRESSLVGAAQKSSEGKSSDKNQEVGFEDTLKEKINIDDDVQCSENDSDCSEETEDENQEVCNSSDASGEIVVSEPCEQVAVETSISDKVNLLNEDVLQQSSTSSSYNSANSEVQVVSNTQTLSAQLDQGTNAAANQQSVVDAGVAEGDLSKVEAVNEQLVQSELVGNKEQIPQSKSTDVEADNNSQVIISASKSEANMMKDASEADSSLLLDENTESEQSSPVVPEVLKQAENIEQTKTAEIKASKADKLKSLKDVSDGSSQQSSNENHVNNNSQLFSASVEPALVSDNVELGSKADSVAEVEVIGKVDNVQQSISGESDGLSTTQQAGTSRVAEQTQNIEILSQSVSKQMQNSVNIALNRNQDQIVVNLSPPELGRVTIKFIENQSQITGVLQVAKPETRAEIENALPHIIRNLEQSGIQVKRIDVEVYDQNNINQQSAKDQGFQGNLSAQQDSSNNQDSSGQSGNGRFEGDSTQSSHSESKHDYSLGSESLNLFA